MQIVVAQLSLDQLRGGRRPVVTSPVNCITDVMLRCSEAGAEPTPHHPIPVVIPRREISDMVRRALFAGAAIALAKAWQADVGTAATIIERTLPASDRSGSLARQYTIAVPDNLATGAQRPGGHGPARLPADPA